ncbi:MAG: flavin monoamine oxidase family protein [Gemmatimonadaceae bacterium]
MKRVDVDVAVVGAGVAGLAAAREMRRIDPRLALILLEARDRIGGRIYTHRENGLPAPIELGAEFVHGSAAATIEIAERAGLLLSDTTGERWSARAGRLTQLHDFWQRLDRVMRRLDAQRTPDRSFQEFIDSRPGGRGLAQDRTLALEFVEGFHAADPSRISERALAAGGSPGEDANEQRMGRILEGYDRVPAWLGETVSDAVQLRSVVSRIAWRRGEVRLTLASDSTAESTEVRARAAIVTVPLGVLLAPAGELGAITFDPPVRRVMEDARGLSMGNVVRITLHLRERFWENEAFISGPPGRSLSALAFLHTRDEDIPVWWTCYPIRAPLIVGWVGGPQASRMLTYSRAEIERRAIASLARQLRLTVRRLRGLVLQSWSHDWTHDPFTRGAYSYALVGGAEAFRRLARPVDGTLYFAGEAADPDGQLGTVSGAIATGLRAAKSCMRTLEQRR